MDKIKAIYPTVVLPAVLLIVSLLSAYLLANVGVVVGPVIIVSLTVILLLTAIIKEYRMGIYAMFLLCVFMSFLNRMLGVQLQFGIPLDALAGITFIVMLLATRGQQDWSVLRSPITYTFIMVVVYQLLQVFNPNATSFVGWLVSLRGNTSFLLFFVFVQLFISFEQVKKFTIFWMVIAALVALYGLWQELAGLNGKELQWIHSTPGRIDLYFIWGHMRKFSFLSDPSAFGLFMGVSALASLVLMMGPFPALTRIMFGILGVIMIVSMSFSGTRTATAMVAFGVCFYILLTLKSRKTILVMIGVGIGALMLFFGPFYGGTMNRIRSTFNTSEDASMGVRDRKRIKAQAYVQTHPFGGGINTTAANGIKYSPGHALSDIGDPDSGYLLTALEMGWIGLLIGLAFFSSVMLKGVQNYFALKDPLLKTATLTYIIPFMSLSVAHFTQDAMFQKPVYLVIIATYALMLRLPHYPQSKPTDL